MQIATFSLVPPHVKKVKTDFALDKTQRFISLMNTAVLFSTPAFVHCGNFICVMFGWTEARLTLALAVYLFKADTAVG